MKSSFLRTAFCLLVSTMILAAAPPPTDITKEVTAAKANTVLLLPKQGNSNVTGPIIYKAGQDHITIDGNGGQLHVRASAGSSIFKPTGCTGFTIRNFALIDEQARDGVPHSVLVYDTGIGTTIADNTIRGLLKVEDSEYGASAPQILSNAIYDTGSVSVYITANHCLVRGNKFQGSMGEYNLRFEPPTDKTGAFLYNPDKSLLKVTSGEVSNNSFCNHNAFYKDCIGIREGDNIVVTGNTIDGSIRLGQVPATLGSCNVGLVITNNTFVAPNADARRYVGTLLCYQGVDKTTIANNTFCSNGESPIQVDQQSVVSVTANVQKAAPGAKVSRLVAISSTGQYGGGAAHNEIDATNKVIVTPATQPAK